MTNDLDNYEAYYGAKLWNLLPAIYRSLDTDQFNSNGPLRELVNRIGVQAATLRRSLDRMWQDQSIETCDDWVIPYIANLLATNLVTNLDPRSQRLDVANTINYRRRKGTLGLLEEIAFNITGWNAKVVEFFRRMARTRHSLDPAIGVRTAGDNDVAKLQLTEGFVGPLTQTSIGGFADLRDAYGALQVDSAFDEFFHTADFRQGRGRVGWYNIPVLGVFLWRLEDFAVGLTTPIEVAGGEGWYTFDPTGRDIPLFAAARTTESYGDNWVSPVAGQLPGPISQQLWDAQLPPSSPEELVAPPSLYPKSLAVYVAPTPLSALPKLIDVSKLKIQTATGRFKASSASNCSYQVIYNYGFSSEIGAGPYDRRVGSAATPTPNPQNYVSAGGKALYGAIPYSGTMTINDSLTYTAISDVKVADQLTLCAAVRQRPVLRPAPKPDGSAHWKFTGGCGRKPSCLVLDGLFICGAEIVLSGDFDCVTINCCTLDPGNAAKHQSSKSSPPSPFAVAADGRELVPCRIWVEGTVKSLNVTRSIVGPIRQRGQGMVESFNITDSIVQAIPAVHVEPVAASFSAGLFDAALAFTDGEVNLSRCTVLGRVVAHQLQASECILQDLVQVDNTQNGCVRFCAYADGSALPRQFESVRIVRQASLFTSTDFGDPGYCQLLTTVDTFILPSTGAAPTKTPTIAAGAADGSEMGAFARDKNPLKQQGLLLKYQEYMPAGLVPVLIFVT